MNEAISDLTRYIGPIIRELQFEGRREFTLKLLPKTLFIVTNLGIIASTSSWFLVNKQGC